MVIQHKTPGVYIIEENAFPNSVVQVATAVPAFVGYTQTAQGGTGSLHMTPVRITSMAEFQQYFGAGHAPLFDLSSTAPKSTTLPKAIFTVQSKDGGTREKHLTLMTTPFCLYESIRMFFNNGGGLCYVVSVGGYSDDQGKDAMIEAAALKAGIETLTTKEEPTLLVVPETTRLSKAESSDLHVAMLAHCGLMKNRFAILDMRGGFRGQDDPDGDPVDEFREGVGTNNLSYGATYYPWVTSTVIAKQDFGLSNFTADARTTLATLLAADAGGDDQDLLAEIAKVATDLEQSQLTALDSVLQAGVPLYSSILDVMSTFANTMPPGAAMAGVYTTVDNEYGVWKAPANISLNSVASLTVNIVADEQGDLHEPLFGRSVNAIRTFIGRGVLVWGARTLDGNSQDWRFISTRRTTLMIEESIKRAAEAYVFEANDANTWAMFQAMIENFLANQWKQGALVGTKPEDAFFVQVGLGSTMTSDDILNGIMNVSVGLAVLRPAEFIILTFQQKMQTS